MSKNQICLKKKGLFKKYDTVNENRSASLPHSNLQLFIYHQTMRDVILLTVYRYFCIALPNTRISFYFLSDSVLSWLSMCLTRLSQMKMKSIFKTVEKADDRMLSSARLHLKKLLSSADTLFKILLVLLLLLARCTSFYTLTRKILLYVSFSTFVSNDVTRLLYKCCSILQVNECFHYQDGRIPQVEHRFSTLRLLLIYALRCGPFLLFLEELEEKLGERMDIVKKRNMKWFRHVARRQGLSNTIMFGTVKGSRPRGKPVRQWADDIKA
ncbi:hypothetical protein GQR58_011590 [Nymphon striatum]|nr:hypothetical protein GQR58_011590 [Nymphon striatum]